VIGQNLGRNKLRAVQRGEAAAADNKKVVALLEQNVIVMGAKLDKITETMDKYTQQHAALAAQRHGIAERKQRIAEMTALLPFLEGDARQQQLEELKKFIKDGAAPASAAVCTA
jgi:small-conductance mechanosensitive channel